MPDLEKRKNMKHDNNGGNIHNDVATGFEHRNKSRSKAWTSIVPSKVSLFRRKKCWLIVLSFEVIHSFCFLASEKTFRNISISFVRVSGLAFDFLGFRFVSGSSPVTHPVSSQLYLGVSLMPYLTLLNNKSLLKGRGCNTAIECMPLKDRSWPQLPSGAGFFSFSLQ